MREARRGIMRGWREERRSEGEGRERGEGKGGIRRGRRESEGKGGEGE